MTAVLTVRNATVDYGGVHAVEDLSLEIEEGVLCGLIGPNGSGKTTLLGAISRLVDLASGTILVGDRDISTCAPHLVASFGVARTFQTVRLMPAMTVLATVMLGAEKHVLRRSVTGNWLRLGRGLSDERRSREAARRALARVGVADMADRYPRTLPYGIERRIEIARALASEPRLLLLDEPTAGMSKSERTEIEDLLLELRGDGLTQVLVEHDLSMIHRVCDYAFVLNFGRLIAAGRPRDVAEQPEVRTAYLGLEAEPVAEGAAR